MAKKSDHTHNTAAMKLRKNFCFCCGPDNPDGMHLKFFFDEASRRTYCTFKLGRRYQGPPGHAHGGIIATILDDAMGKVNKMRSVVALTKSMTIDYLRPVPLCATLLVEGTEEKVEGRKHTNLAAIKNEAGEILARSTGLFIAIDAEAMFAKHLKKGEGSGPLANR